MADMSDQIKDHMPIVGAEGEHVGTVDHLDAGGTIKVTRDQQGNHHWIPLDWVLKVDEHVHLDRPGGQATQDWLDNPPK